MATEIWKSIPIKEIKGEYKISESGRVKRRGRYAKIKGHWIPEKFIIPQLDKRKGYLRIILHKNGYSKRYPIHRLVALTFIDNPENKPCINHKDGIKTNNHISNLEWCTAAENNKHAYENGLFNLSGSLKITEEERGFIKENFGKIPTNELSRRFNITKQTVYVIGTNRDKRGKKIYLGYKHIKPPTNHRRVVNIETNEVYNSAKEIILLTGINKSTLYNKLIGNKRNNTPYRYV